MRTVLAGVLVGAFLAGVGASAEESACRVDNPLGLRVIRCDEDPAVIDEAMARAQASCGELSAEDQASCVEAIAESFALRRESMIRRAVRAGWATDAIESRYWASAQEVQRVQAEMAPKQSAIDPEAQARAAEERLALEGELADWMAREGVE